MSPQIPDVFEIEGQTYRPYQTDPYIALEGDGSLVINTWTEEEVLRNYASIPSICARNYVACWEIKNGILYLNKLYSRQYRAVCDLPVVASWFSGTIHIDQGEIIHHSYVRDWYEMQWIISVENGRITGSEMRHNPRPEPDRPEPVPRRKTLAGGIVKALRRLWRRDG